MASTFTALGLSLTADERFVRASGPGGQNVNKVSTAVEMRFNIGASPLPQEVKHRLRALAGRRVDSDDVLLIDSRAHRTQLQNRESAQQRLQELIEKAAVRPKKRTATKPKAAARERRLTTKKVRATVKASRRRTRDDD